MENKVGQVNFEVRADTSKLDADLEAARRKAEETAARIPPIMPGGGMPGIPGGPGVPTRPTPPPIPPQPSPDSGGSGIPGSPDFLDPMKGLGRWRSAMGLILQVSAAGVAAGVAITKAWDHFFTSGAEKAKRFKDALDLSDLKGSTDALSKEYLDLTNRLDKALQGGFLNTINTFIKGDSVAKLNEQIQSIETTARLQQQALNAQELRAKEKKQADAKAALQAEEQAEMESIRKRVEAARIALLDGEAKITAEAQRDEAEIQKQIENAKTESAKRALQEESELRGLQYRKDLDAFRAAEKEKKDAETKRLQELEKAEQERIEATAKALRDEANRAEEQFKRLVQSTSQAIRNLRDQNNSILPAGNIEAAESGLQTQLEVIAQQLAGITDSDIQNSRTSPYE